MFLTVLLLDWLQLLVEQQWRTRPRCAVFIVTDTPASRCLINCRRVCQIRVRVIFPLRDVLRLLIALEPFRAIRYRSQVSRTCDFCQDLGEGKRPVKGCGKILRYYITGFVCSACAFIRSNLVRLQFST